MDPWLATVLGGLGGATLAVGLLYFRNRLQILDSEKRANELREQALRESESVKKQSLLDAREEAMREREKLLKEVEASRKEIISAERDVEKLRLQIEQKEGDIVKRERTLETAQRRAADAVEQVERRKSNLDKIINDQRTLLEKITGLGRDEAKSLLLDRLQRDMEDEVGTRIAAHENRLKALAAEKSREVILTAIQRYAAEHTAASTVTTVDLPSDDVKGRIIGREGRNIRAFEKATGVDVVVDDTPGVVVVSAFDNIRREVGRLALQRLIADGRIHPTRIEEVVAETREEIEAHIVDLGKKAAHEAGVPRLNERIIELLGRLRFRTSYSQNVLNHSVEVAHICGLIAEEIGLDPALARRCGLLHDVGKALDHELEGGHPQIGADVARRCGENETVLHAIAGHHDDLRIERPYTVLVAAADAISASRPGARRETLEKYVKRLQDLEAVACEFEEVESAFAIQAGREVRVLVDANKTTDEVAARICREIAQAIQDRVDYPGEVKVTVLRETRAVEYAR
jgi:ribonuclease Y